MAVTSLSLSRPANAACAVPATNYGTATTKLTIATAGSYRIWTQMMAPDTTNNSYLLEIDGGTCYAVGGGLSANAWTWVDYQGGVKTSKITASLTAGTHTVKIIGSQPKVKIGRILAAADQNCMPTGFGENCMAAADTVKPSTTITMPGNLSTVSGTVSIKATAIDNTGISKIEFYIQDVLKATTATNPYEYKWDTSAYANGDYVLTAKAYDLSGNTSFDTRSVTVKNGVVEAPKAPGSITAKANSATEVVLAWKASATQTAGLRYRIVRDNVVIATVSTLTYTDKTVAPATKYAYHVVAVDKDNSTSGLPTSPVTVTTPALPVGDTQAPSKPTNVVAKPVSTTQINLTWNVSSDNTSVKNYDIYRAKKDTQVVKITTVTGNAYGDIGLESGVAYTYYVIANDTAGNRSAESNKSTVTTETTPPVSQRPGSVRGTIKSTSGRPLSGAKVMIWIGNKRYQATTNWRGQYAINHIPAGRYEIKVKARSYDTKTFDIKINAGKTKWVDATLRR